MKNKLELNFTTKAFKAFVVFGLLISTVESLKSQTADAGLDQTICEGSSVTIGGSPTASGGLAPYTYSWTPATGLSSSTVANPLASPTVTTTYTVTITDANLTSTSDVVTVTVNPLPTITANSNTPICEGSQLFLSGSVLGGAVFMWSGPDGFSSTLLNSQINPATALAAGTYTLTATSASGCTNSNTTNVTVNSTPSVTITSTTNPTCNGFSDGTATATVVGGTAPYVYSWSPSTSTTITATNLSSGNHTVYVVDANACTGQANATLIDPPAITMSVFSPTVCLGDSATINPIVNGGVPPYTYVWDQGGTYFYTPTLTLAPTSGTTFTLTVTDANGCYTNANPGITVNPLTDITGAVSYSGGALTNGGTAVLFKYEFTAMTFDTVQTSPIDASGNYIFSSAPNGFYLVKIFGDTMLYPGVVPTYYTSEYLWNMATIVSHGCVSNTMANITMVEGVAGVGPGMISGHVFEGPGFQRLEGDPIPGIDIKLGRNPGGQLIASTTTDATTGAFSFTNVPINNPGEYYTVYVDIPGLDRDSTYIVVVTAGDFIYTQLDHKVDSNSVYPIYPIVTSISNYSLAKQNKFNVYPNPFKDNITLSYTLNATAAVKLEVFNVLGEKVQSIVNANQQAGEFKYTLENNLNAGVYFVSLTIDGKTSTQRIIKTN